MREGKPPRLPAAFFEGTSKPPLRGFGVRADAAKIKEAHRLGIDIGDVFRQALDKAIYLHSNRCPTCSHTKKS